MDDLIYEPVEQPPLKELEPCWWESQYTPLTEDNEWEPTDQEARDDFNKLAQDNWAENHV